MNAVIKQILARVESWPEAEQQELAELVLEIDARRHGEYQATPEELRMIDQAVAAVERGEVATEEEVEAVLAKYRRP